MPFDLLSELGYDTSDPDVAAAMEDAEDHARLIETLVSLRKTQNLRQTDVAETLGVTQSSVSDFERIGGDPKLSTIQRYARALDARLRLVVETTRRVDDRWLEVSENRAHTSWAPPKQVPTWRVASSNIAEVG